MTRFSHIHGVILQVISVKDHDAIITIFSQEQGKCGVYAKGIKKSTSKLGAFLQKGMIGKFELIQAKNNMPQLKSVESIFLPECEHYEMLTKFHQSLELCYRLFQEEQVLEPVFRIVMDFIPFSCQSYSPLLYSSFTLKILTALGFLGNLKFCSHCNEKCSPVNQYFSAEKGTVCNSCANSLLPIISFTTLKILAFLQTASFPEIKQLRISEKERNEADQFISLLKKPHLEKPLKSEN